jgi:hypothetical protein
MVCGVAEAATAAIKMGKRVTARREPKLQSRPACDLPLRASVLTFDAGTARQRTNAAQVTAVRLDEVFALVARHPLLTRHQLASLPTRPRRVFLVWRRS